MNAIISVPNNVEGNCTCANFKSMTALVCFPFEYYQLGSVIDDLEYRWSEFRNSHTTIYSLNELIVSVFRKED